MSDWLGEIKKRMKGPMLSASMTKGVRRDMNWLISEVERLLARLNDPQECNSGHKDYPLTLWDCPTCVQNRLEAKDGKIERLQHGLHDAEAIGDFPTELRDRLFLKESAEALQILVRDKDTTITKLQKAVETGRQNKIDRCAETGCMCDLRDTHCWSYFDEVLGFAEKN